MKPATCVVRISRHLDERLDALAAKTGRRKSYYASKAIEQYLEDREDYLLAVAAYEESKGQRRYSLEEVEKRLGLEPLDDAGRRKGAGKAGRDRPTARKKVS
jgi:RHH-type rel operon transcriptional repressor/antitoxin RelB